MTGPTMPGMVAKVLVIPSRIPANLHTHAHTHRFCETQIAAGFSETPPEFHVAVRLRRRWKKGRGRREGRRRKGRRGRRGGGGRRKRTKKRRTGERE